MKIDEEKAKNFLSDVLIEYKNARKKYAPMISYHEGWAIIWEELDELWDEVRAKPHEESKMYKELVQTAAMCLAYSNELIKDEIVNGY